MGKCYERREGSKNRRRSQKSSGADQKKARGEMETKEKLKTGWSDRECEEKKKTV